MLLVIMAFWFVSGARDSLVWVLRELHLQFDSVRQDLLAFLMCIETIGSHLLRRPITQINYFKFLSCLILFHGKKYGYCCERLIGILDVGTLQALFVGLQCSGILCIYKHFDYLKKYCTKNITYSKLIDKKKSQG